MNENSVAKVRHAVVRSKVLDALAGSDKPMTVGELFLITRYSQATIMKTLKELRAQGIVASEVRRAGMTTYSGQYVEYDAMHWWLAKPVSRS